MSRDSVLRGDIVELTAVFYDAIGNPTNPSDILFSVYPPGSNPEHDGVTTADAWVYNVTLTSGGSGPLANANNLLEETSTGHYRYSFTVPEDADLGSGFDRWEATLDSQSLDETFNFVIVGGGSVGTTILYENNIVYIELSDKILAEDGASLGSDEIFYFTTTYNPLYVSSRQVRLELGFFASSIPEDTINLAIYEAGKDLDANLFNSVGSNQDYFNYVKEEYVKISASLMVLNGMMGDVNLTGRLSKALGDMSVMKDGNADMLLEREYALTKELKGLLKAIRTGGRVTPETSLKPGVTVKGESSIDAISVERQWEPMSGVGIPRSAANTSIRHVGGSSRRRHRTFKNRTSRGGN